MSEEQPPSPEQVNEFRSTRRGVLAGMSALGTVTALQGGRFKMKTGEIYADPWSQSEGEPITIPKTSAPRHWLGPSMWGNRLQDWHVNKGRLECLRGEASYECRTVGILNRKLVQSTEPGHLRAQTGVIEDAGEGGFAGFLIGVGNGDLEYEAAALAQRSSGTGGGVLCTYETDGQVRFRDHTDETDPVAYEEIPPDKVLDTTFSGEPPLEDGVHIALDLLPENGGTYSLVLKVTDSKSGNLVSGAVLEGVRESMLLGGISLVSSPYPDTNGARWWFDEIETAGEKVGVFPDRTFGPIAGTLYSVSESGLKLNAQLFPVNTADSQVVEFRYRRADSTEEWQREITTLGPGYTALFQVENWDATQACDYEVTWESENDKWTYEGQIAAETSHPDELTIGLVSCTIACNRQLGIDTYREIAPETSNPGKYTSENIYIPYPELTEHLDAQNPDLLVFAGDQFYEDSPTRAEDQEDPGLDYLYKWFLWLWSFRDLTRKTSAIVLTDDHDLYQSNLWGEGGKELPKLENETPTQQNTYDFNEGGYVGTPEFVNRAQRIQTSHNPNWNESKPVNRGIDVYYGSFTYGGTDFAILEDRKFKTGPDIDPVHETAEPTLLGDRQLDFLEEWADSNPELPKVCLSQTCYAAAQTSPDGQPMLDPDTNGFPKAGRDRALDVLREAEALMLAGDQHLATLLRHGLNTYTDGVVQFCGPAGGALFQRWFEPKESLENGRGIPNTGYFTDGFGNKLRMLGVANPKLSFDEYQNQYGRGRYLFDAELKSEGYGIVRVKQEEKAFVIECWPRDVDPTDADAEQFRGWPYRLPFNETSGQ